MLETSSNSRLTLGERPRNAKRMKPNAPVPTLETKSNSGFNVERTKIKVRLTLESKKKNPISAHRLAIEA